MPRARSIPVALCVLSLLAACGGGGGGSSPPATPTPTPPAALVWGTGKWGTNQWSAASAPVLLETKTEPSSSLLVRNSQETSR